MADLFIVRLTTAEADLLRAAVPILRRLAPSHQLADLEAVAAKLGDARPAGQLRSPVPAHVHWFGEPDATGVRRCQQEGCATTHRRLGGVESPPAGVPAAVELGGGEVEDEGEDDLEGGHTTLPRSCEPGDRTR